MSEDYREMVAGDLWPPSLLGRWGGAVACVDWGGGRYDYTQCGYFKYNYRKQV